MKSIRTLLVDDEALARERLIQLLRPFKDIQVVGEAEDGEEAIQKVIELTPHLVFLDIQMPGCGGMEVAASLPAPRPIIIFCTAYDQYAVDAFELNAVDYLLKPVSRTRLAKALDRVRRASRSESDARLDRIAPSGVGFPSRFLAKRASRFHVIPQHQVLYFGSEEGLTKLCTPEHEYWMQPNLSDLEKRLDPGRFCRISRSAIVNLQTIRQVVPLIGGHGEVVLSSGLRLDVSRRRFKPLLEKLEGKS